jgi:hypothetical protein
MSLHIQHVGQTRGPGRPKGALNNINADVRAMILDALNRVGGERYLARQAEKNPVAFMSLVGRILPTTVSNADGSPIALHLLAAQLVSKHILEMQIEPPTIVDVEQPQHRNLLDAPPPTE